MFSIDPPLYLYVSGLESTIGSSTSRLWSSTAWPQNFDVSDIRVALNYGSGLPRNLGGAPQPSHGTPMLVIQRRHCIMGRVYLEIQVETRLKEPIGDRIGLQLRSPLVIQKISTSLCGYTGQQEDCLATMIYLDLHNPPCPTPIVPLPDGFLGGLWQRCLSHTKHSVTLQGTRDRFSIVSCSLLSPILLILLPFFSLLHLCVSWLSRPKGFITLGYQAPTRVLNYKKMPRVPVPI